MGMPMHLPARIHARSLDKSAKLWRDKCLALLVQARHPVQLDEPLVVTRGRHRQDEARTVTPLDIR